MSTPDARVSQFGFVVCLLILSWQVMTTTHELGHVGAALASGGRIQSVDLPLLGISSTNVAPNPAPGFVVWAGPLAGCALPLLLMILVPRRCAASCLIARFLSGFSLMANGAYIAGGSFHAIGDCAQMYQTGTPQWVMLVAGSTMSVCGLIIWHRMGSLGQFFASPQFITRRVLMSTAIATLLVVVLDVTATRFLFQN